MMEHNGHFIALYMISGTMCLWLLSHTLALDLPS